MYAHSIENRFDRIGSFPQPGRAKSGCVTFGSDSYICPYVRKRIIASRTENRRSIITTPSERRGLSVEVISDSMKSYYVCHT
jgi:hypothetical protein